MKYMVVDTTKCNGCFNCQIACKDEHVDNDWAPYARPQPDMGHFWMKLNLVERGTYPKVKLNYFPVRCMHCEKPKCIKAAKNGAMYKRDDDIVMIDPEKAKGQKQLVDACPYGVIYWNKDLKIPQKCTFCAHLLDEGKIKEPRCIEACPTSVMTLVEEDELKKIIKEKKAEVLHPEFRTKPRVYYIGLPKKFVAGTAVFDDTDDCAEGVSVTLTGERIKKTVKTNNYGDFEFEGLPDDMEYKVTLSLKGYKPKELKAKTKTDVYLGNIVLTST